MNIWIDAQLPPDLALWLSATFGVEANSLRDLGLRDAKDEEIFQAARDAEAVVLMSKDSDFVDLICRFGSPPQLIWVTCGNVTNRALRKLLLETFSDALQQLEAGEEIVEIG